MSRIETIKAAWISRCGQYRYWLWRTWDSKRPKMVWIMLNPSTADAELDDPTIRKCMGFAQRWGFGGILVLNLFAYRATAPKKLKEVGLEAVGNPENDRLIQNRAALAKERLFVAAWGAHGSYLNREAEVREILNGNPVMCLGTTKDGHPRHPLYVPYDTELVNFDPVDPVNPVQKNQKGDPHAPANNRR